MVQSTIAADFIVTSVHRNNRSVVDQPKFLCPLVNRRIHAEPGTKVKQEEIHKLSLHIV